MFGIASIIQFKMDTNENQINGCAMSDFSIDHILNRAGERFLKKHRNSEQYFETISSGSSSCGDETNSCDNYDERYFQAKFSDGERFMDLPSFDWLNYTRYNMPRLPSK